MIKQEMPQKFAFGVSQASLVEPSLVFTKSCSGVINYLIDSVS